MFSHLEEIAKLSSEEYKTKYKNIPNLHFRKVIAHGGNGIVHKALYGEHHSPVAVKEFPRIPLNAFPDQNVSLVNHHINIREVEFLKQLKHKNIVKFYGLQTKIIPEGIICMAILEYCPLTLEKVIANSDTCFSYGHKKSIVHQIANALDCLVKLSIVHCDLKPANILVSQDGHLKLTDFGLSTILLKVDGYKSSKFNVVTLWYRAPEIFEKKPYGFGIDMWSFGLIITELWLRKPLLQGKDDNDQYKKICGLFTEGQECIHNIFVSIEPRASELIKGLLARNPELRFDIADVMKSSFLNTGLPEDDPGPSILPEKFRSFPLEVPSNPNHKSPITYIQNGFPPVTISPSENSCQKNYSKALTSCNNIIFIINTKDPRILFARKKHKKWLKNLLFQSKRLFDKKSSLQLPEEQLKTNLDKKPSPPFFNEQRKDQIASHSPSKKNDRISFDWLENQILSLHSISPKNGLSPFQSRSSFSPRLNESRALASCSKESKTSPRAISDEEKLVPYNSPIKSTDSSPSQLISPERYKNTPNRTLKKKSNDLPHSPPIEKYHLPTRTISNAKYFENQKRESQFQSPFHFHLKENSSSSNSPNQKDLPFIPKNQSPPKPFLTIDLHNSSFSDNLKTSSKKRYLSRSPPQDRYSFPNDSQKERRNRPFQNSNRKPAHKESFGSLSKQKCKSSAAHLSHVQNPKTSSLQKKWTATLHDQNFDRSASCDKLQRTSFHCIQEKRQFSPCHSISKKRKRFRCISENSESPQEHHNPLRNRRSPFCSSSLKTTENSVYNGSSKIQDHSPIFENEYSRISSNLSEPVSPDGSYLDPPRHDNISSLVSKDKYSRIPQSTLYRRQRRPSVSIMKTVYRDVSHSRFIPDKRNRIQDRFKPHHLSRQTSTNFRSRSNSPNRLQKCLGRNRLRRSHSLLKQRDHRNNFQQSRHRTSSFIRHQRNRNSPRRCSSPERHRSIRSPSRNTRRSVWHSRRRSPFRHTPQRKQPSRSYSFSKRDEASREHLPTHHQKMERTRYHCSSRNHPYASRRH